MEEYSEALLLRIGPKSMGIMAITLKMIRPGYFLLTINPNSKFNKKTKKRRYGMIIHN